MAILRRCLAAILCMFLLPFGDSIAGAATVSRLGSATLHHLPAGLGASADFDYRFARVSFVSRVWESGSDAHGWRVDLDIVVMSGAHSRTPRMLHDWFIRYEQRSPAEARYRRVRVAGRPGWASRDQVFWLVRPGAAVSVYLDRTRWSRRALFRTARGVRVGWFPPRPLMTETGTRSSLAR